MRRFHRIVGSILVLPLVVWIATGVLFHVKHRYDEAYEALTVPPEREIDWGSARLAPAEVLARGLADAPLVLAAHPSGALAYFGRRGAEPVAIDAASGAALAAADEALARRWIASALERSPHAGRYGELLEVQPARSVSALTGAEDPALVVATSGSKSITVDLVTGELRQSGALNDFIDATYALHYLQWTPWPPVNVALVLLAAPLVLLLAFTGARLAWGQRGGAAGRRRAAGWLALALSVGAASACRAATVADSTPGSTGVGTTVAAGELDPDERARVRATLERLYGAFGFEAGGEPDWATLRELSVEGAVWVEPFARGASPRALATEAFLDGFRAALESEPSLAGGLLERVLGTRIDLFGVIAHAWVAFEGHAPGESAARTRGLDSIQLVLDRDRWRVASFTTQYETAGRALPRRFLAEGGP